MQILLVMDAVKGGGVFAVVTVIDLVVHLYATAMVSAADVAQRPIVARLTAGL